MSIAEVVLELATTYINSNILYNVCSTARVQKLEDIIQYIDSLADPGPDVLKVRAVAEIYYQTKKIN